MAEVPGDDSLERIVHLLETHNPNLLELLRAKTEEEFMEAVEGALERAVRLIEQGAKRYWELDERGLSGLLVGFLDALGYHACAEREHNGHVDVVVEHAFGGRWKYLGECKLYNGFKYHVAGCEQLLGYCSGREQRAFCLGFFKSAAMYEKLLALRERFDQERPAAQNAASSDHAIRGAFVTEHRHSSGRSVELLHLGCAVCVSTLE